MELTVEEALERGIIAHKEGKLKEAEKFYRAIIQIHPKNPDANHNLGVLAAQINKLDQALPLFKNALQSNPNKEQFWVSYIEALIKEQQFILANQVLRQGEKHGLSRKNIELLETKLTSNSAEGNTSNSSPSQEKLRLLLESYQAGLYEDAEKLGVSITKEFPSHQFGWKVLGAIFSQLGKKTQAVNANQMAIQLAPKDSEAYSNLGGSLKQIGRFDTAKLSYRRALVLQTDNFQAYNNLGGTLKEIGRLDDAEVTYRKATVCKPNFAEAHSNLANILIALGRFEASEKSCRRAITEKFDSAGAYNNLGVVLRKMKKLEDANIAYKKAILCQPSYSRAYSNLANMLTELGGLEQAIDNFKIANLLNPRLDNEIGFAATYLQNNEPQNALPLLEKYLDKYPRDIRAYAYKTIALRGAGNFKKVDELIRFSDLVKPIDAQLVSDAELIQFNKQLKKVLINDPRRRPEDDQEGWAIRGGTVIRNLFDNIDPIIVQFEALLRNSIAEYIKSLPHDPQHPFLMIKSEAFEISSCWVNFLEQDDFQSNHIHNNAWISGVYYLDEPEIEGNNEHAGWIEFNRAGYNLPHFSGDRGIELIRPEAGKFIFFPSYVWHGTIPYKHSYTRISISFDINLL